MDPNNLEVSTWDMEANVCVDCDAPLLSVTQDTTSVNDALGDPTAVNAPPATTAGPTTTGPTTTTTATRTTGAPGTPCSNADCYDRASSWTGTRPSCACTGCTGGSSGPRCEAGPTTTTTATATTAATTAAGLSGNGDTGSTGGMSGDDQLVLGIGIGVASCAVLGIVVWCVHKRQGEDPRG
jgi:hypothetical protein